MLHAHILIHYYPFFNTVKDSFLHSAQAAREEGLSYVHRVWRILCRRWRRCVNVVAHLCQRAEVCAAQVNVSLHEDMVVRYRATPAQVGLTASERLQNVAGAFRCSPAFATGALYGRKILIVDH